LLPPLPLLCRDPSSVPQLSLRSLLPAACVGDCCPALLPKPVFAPPELRRCE
jgi:hypothetical protein